LKQKNATLEASTKSVTDENVKLREKLHLAKARELAITRLTLGQLEVKTDADFENIVVELAKRSEDSLNDAIKDNAVAFQKALKAKADASQFLKEKGDEKPPVTLNGDTTNDKEAQTKLKAEKAEKLAVDRKSEKSKDL
jgi:hypothetical protein